MMSFPTVYCLSRLLLQLWVCLLYPYYTPPPQPLQRKTRLKSKPQLRRTAQQSPNQWRLCQEFDEWRPGWLHAAEMSGVMMGVLPLRWRNPHCSLIRTCQVSIKELPSPPRVSIEIRLTNKNSLAAVCGLPALLCCASHRLHCEEQKMRRVLWTSSPFISP